MVQVELCDRVRGRTRRNTILDTGAPFSVIPFSIWNGQNLPWSPLGSQLLTLKGQPAPDGLKWLGIPCEFGATQIALVDDTNQTSRFLHVVGKLVLSLLPARFERNMILGYNFLMDNPFTLTVNPASRASAGSLANVVGFLTLR